MPGMKLSTRACRRKAKHLATVLVIGLALAVSGAQAAPPSVDGVVKTGTTQGSSITISHTTGSGSDRLMIVGISLLNDSFETVTSVKYNGVDLTLAGSEVNSVGVFVRDVLNE